MNRLEHDRIEEWAKKYAGLALMGFLCTLLIVGKFVHYIFLNRGLVCGILVIPPALLSGIIGLVWFAIMDRIDPVMTDDLAAGLEMMKTNLLNFVFASLMLGLSCSRSSSKHSTIKGILASVLHEGMPMIIYSQILTWGQTSICLAICFISELMGKNIPRMFSAMVPLGLEAGDDATPTPVHNNFWSATVVQESESLGIVTAAVLGVIAISAKPYLMSCGVLGSASTRESSANMQPASNHSEEAFGRTSSSVRLSSEPPSMTTQRMVSGDKSMSRITDLPVMALKMEDVYTYRGNKSDTEKLEGQASLGTHLSLVALTVFLSFNVGLTARIFEAQFSFFKSHRIFSGICMYKISMCCALISMNFFLRRSRIRFRREWFMRLCGLMLDMLVIAALSTANPKPKALKEAHYDIVAVFVAACVGWNIFAFFFLARRLFPNFWYERGLTLSGNSLGHSFMGLLFARTLDPTLETPAPTAYAYKLMIFFIPSSGGKNNIVVSIVDSHGCFVALLVCLCVVTAWLIIFEKHFKHRFINGKCGNSRRASGKDSRDMDDEVDPEIEEMLSFDDLEEELLPGSSSHGTQRVSVSPVDLRPQVPNSASINPIHSDYTSLIVSPSQMALIAKWMPEAEVCRNWVLKYSLRQDGANLSTLISLCTARNDRGRATYSSCLIIVEDSWGYIFGGYIAHELQNSSAYYGNGESFVYSLVPKAEKFKWTGANDFFIVSSPHQLAMGGGGDGFAFQMDDELDTGVSNRSDTYSNPILSSNEFFKCLNVEVWTLENVGFSI